MRITNNMLISNMRYNLNQRMQKLERLQYESAEGKKFRVPSDDPIGASKSLKFNTDISKVEQYHRNAKDANSWMKETEFALKEVYTVLHRANVLTVQAANGPNAAELDKIKDEISELKEHLIQIGNSTYAGRSLFTGFKTDEKLLKENGDYNVNIGLADDNATIIDEVFVYNVGVAEQVNVNTLGNKVFGQSTIDGNNMIGTSDYTGDVTAGASPHLINIFTQLQKALDDGDNDQIQHALGNIKDSMNQVLSVTSEIGARSNRLNLTEGKLEEQIVNLKDLLSYNEDVSLPEALMKLAIEENAYMASLGVSGRIIQPTLMDFLR